MYEISPDIVKTVRNDIIPIIRAKVDDYSDLNNLLMLLKQKAKPWELIPAIAFYAETLYLKETTDSERMALLDLIELEEESLESEYAFLSMPSENTPYYRLRVLFYTQLALSTIILIKSKIGFNESKLNPNRYADNSLLRRRGISLIHEMAGINSLVPWEQFPYQAKQDVIVYHDIAESKLAANDFIYSLLIKEETPNHAEYLYYASETWKERLPQPHSQYWNTIEILNYFPFLDKVKFDTFIINIFSAIDLWTIVCEKEDEKEKSFPTLRWFDLFASIASFFPNSIYDLNNVESPERCRKESSQYLSWKLGYTIGNCIKSAKKSHIEADQVLDFLIQESIKQNADYKINFVQDTKNIYSALPAIIGIINNVNKTTEWPENRRRALALWKNYKKTDQTPLAQITPGTDLYWAINTGICDSMLMGEILRERSNDFVLSSSDVLNIKKEIDDSTGPSSKSVSDQDIEEALKNRLGSIYDILPEKIIEPLKYCKNNCRTNLEIIHCLVDYDLAIKYWIQRLLTFHLDREINLFKSPDLLRRGQKTSLPSDLANAEWGIIFKDIYRAIPNNPEKRHWIYRATFESYYKKYLNPIQPDDFRRVGEHLQAIGSIRNQVLHESDKEISEKRYRTLLSDMDKLVLGSEGKPGLIKDIYRLFQNNKSQSSEWS